MTHTSGLASGGLGNRRVPQGSLWPGEQETLDRRSCRGWRRSRSTSSRGRAGDTADWPASTRSAGSSRSPPGQSFDEFLKRRIFEPLGMNDTFFVVPDDRKDRLATVYRGTENGLEKSTFTLRFPKTYYSGAGGLSSSAADYFRFAQMLANRGELGGRRLLSPRAVELFSSNHVGDMMPGQLGRPPGMGFGLTVEVLVDPGPGGELPLEGQLRLGRRLRHALLGRSQGTARRRLPRPGTGRAGRRGHPARLRDRRDAGGRRVIPIASSRGQAAPMHEI